MGTRVVRYIVRDIFFWLQTILVYTVVTLREHAYKVLQDQAC